jgi:hypothetical protein
MSSFEPPEAAVSPGDFTEFCDHGKYSKLHIPLLLFYGDCNLQSTKMMTYQITWDTDVVLEC